MKGGVASGQAVVWRTYPLQTWAEAGSRSVDQSRRGTEGQQGSGGEVKADRDY